MAAIPKPRGFRPLVILLTALSSLIAHACAAAETQYIYGTGADGVTRELAVDRYPALYTGDFGDCLGGQSLFNITKFDAAYYADNMTVLFHLDGASNIRNESLMMIITMEAYGEVRYTQTFDPCFVNMWSLCPLNASVPINGYASFPLGQQQIGDIPSIALDIPDFDGFVRMQIFANSSQTQIGCFQAVMTNGNSFGHPEALGPILAFFTALAILASLATAAFGISIPHMRTHYAHTFSVLLVFETFQAVFFSSALNVPWPSALVAWWSNFAWSAGLIYTPAMMSSIGSFTGISGNSSQVGGAGSTVIANQGGMASQIYARAMDGLVKRKPYNENDPFDYRWGGDPVKPGMPLPGTWPGFRGQLSVIGIPAADAFLVALIWLLVAIGILVLAFVVFRAIVEYLVRYTWVEKDAFGHFYKHYMRYAGLAVLRAVFIAFFMMTTLAIFQFSVHGSAGATAIAAIVFLLFLGGVGGLVAYACHFRLRFGRYSVESDAIVLERTRLFNAIPIVWLTRSSTLKEKELAVRPAGSISFVRIAYTDDDPSRATVHEDAAFIKRFGWLSARYRRTKWWFFAYYLVYQFFRAVILGGGGGNSLAQVYGFFIYEIVAFFLIVKINPYEGRRNTALGVWMLGICKVGTAGLSIGLLPAFKLNRIIATVIGVVIIVIQAFVVIAVMILAVLGTVSSWWSLARNREDFEPEFMDRMRLKYFEKLLTAAPDDLRSKKAKPAVEVEKEKEKKKKLLKGRSRQSLLGKSRTSLAKSEPELQIPKEPYFAVTSVRRAPKIEDEDEDVVADMEAPHNNSTIFDPDRVMNRPDRASSVNSRYSVGSLPRGARPHRMSWSHKDFAQWDASRTNLERPESALAPRRSASHAGLGAVAKAARSSTNPAPLSLLPRASLGSLRGSNPASPTTPLSPDKETLARHASERMASPPPVPETPSSRGKEESP